jgi:hypothetical protein
MLLPPVVLVVLRLKGHGNKMIGGKHELVR